MTTKATYKDIEKESDISDKQVTSVHAFCFYNDQFVIVYAPKKGTWTPPGGKVEDGESALEATIREVKEESNMKVLSHRFIGLQEVHDPENPIIQAALVCLVEPYGDFVEDPDDKDITEIKLIDPADYKRYFDWKESGDHIMKKAMQLKVVMENGL